MFPQNLSHPRVYVVPNLGSNLCFLVEYIDRQSLTRGQVFARQTRTAALDSVTLGTGCHAC